MVIIRYHYKMEDMDQAMETPFEEQRASALEFYQEMSSKAMMSSTFIDEAIREYQPDKIRDLKLELEHLKDWRGENFLLALVDKVWNEATDSEEVPFTARAMRLIRETERNY